MRIVFKSVKNGDEIINEPLFCWNEDDYKNVHRETLIPIMNSLTDENTSIFSLYAGNYEFHDCPPRYGREGGKHIEILVRLKNGKVNEILKTGEKYSHFSETAELLNKEVKEEGITYEVFYVQGELK
jgi:hypothetical protein